MQCRCDAGIENIEQEVDQTGSLKKPVGGVKLLTDATDGLYEQKCSSQDDGKSNLLMFRESFPLVSLSKLD